MYGGKTIAAVIPAYNEESFVGDVVETLPEFVDRAYVIDDASTDDTWAELQRAAETVNDEWDAENDASHAEVAPEDAHASPQTASDGGVGFGRRVVPIQHEENRGVGGAIKTGYQHALDDGVDVTAVIAGDGQTEPDIVERIITPVVEGDADYAKGNRLLSQDRSDMPLFRQVGNFVLTVITKIASGYWKLMDPQNGSTAISHEALAAVDIDEMYEDYGYCNDLLIRCNTNQLRVADVSRRAVYKDEESHITYSTYIPKVSALLLRGFLRRLHARYLGRDFHPLPFFYYLGAAGAGAGLVATLKNVVSDDADVAGSLGLFLLGWLFMLLAMVFDLDENRGLDVQVYD
ncbi:glycosyltransferase family 2 protein [Natronoarchaeum rubrum]|uniref:glycosyltransferase family 2 protein n=1 Tax=Natronoarchaeum rubrum TaxID=755311 RepID=UPI0021115889|nr:glycosyltransferase family 2 protein [Natronoarchaeum rubrum]